MAVNISGRKGGVSGDSDGTIFEFVLDDANDIPNLPTTARTLPGSTAFVISTGQVLMLGSTGWRQI